MLRNWEASSGFLRWEVIAGQHYVEEEVEDLPLDSDWRPGGISMRLAGAKQGGKQLVKSALTQDAHPLSLTHSHPDILVLAVRENLFAFSTRSGKLIWKHLIPNRY